MGRETLTFEGGTLDAMTALYAYSQVSDEVRRQERKCSMVLCVESKDAVAGTVLLHARERIREELYHTKDI